MLGSPVDRRVSSIAMKPSAVSGIPVSASQGAAPASVTHRASSKAIRFPSSQISAAGSTLTISLSVSTATRRSTRIRSKRRRTCRLCEGSRASRVTRVTSTAPPHRPASRYCAESASSTPEAPPRHLLGSGEQRFPPTGEAGDRLDRDRVLGGTGDIAGPRRRADVDRQQVPADRRVGAAQHRTPAPVEADRLVADQPRSGKPREPTEIDVALLKGVMPRDIARQHARIGRLDVAADQGDAHTGHRPHAKTLQHADMSMAAADENEILSDRNALLHRLHYARAPPGRRAEPDAGRVRVPWSTGTYCEKADSGPSSDRQPASKCLIFRHSRKQIP